MSWKSSTDRYGSVAVTFHWITATAIFVLLALGFLAASSASPAAKAAILRVHAPLGIFILAVTILRMGWWFADRRPNRIAHLPRWQSLAERLVHTLLYLTIIVMGVSGIGMIALSGAGAILFGGSPLPLPNFWNYAPRIPHGLGAFALLGLVLLHVGAALYHQLVRRDRLLARMGIGRVAGEPRGAAQFDLDIPDMTPGERM